MCTPACLPACLLAWACRAAGEMLLDELFEAFDGEVVAPLAAAVQARLQVGWGCGVEWGGWVGWGPQVSVVSRCGGT